MGSWLDGGTPQSPTEVATRQRLSGKRSSAANELLLEMLQVGVPCSHGNRQYMDTSTRYD